MLRSGSLSALQLFGVSSSKRYADDLNRSSSLPLETRQTRQLGRLNALLQTASTSVPLHRERLGSVRKTGLGDLSELRSLPVTTKADLKAGFPDFVTNQDLPRDSWRYVSTSGTVERVVTVEHWNSRDRARGAVLHVCRTGAGYRAGNILRIAPNACNVVCGEGETAERESLRREAWAFIKSRCQRRSYDSSNLRGAWERRITFRTRQLDPLAPQGTHVPEARLKSYWDRIVDEDPCLIRALPEYLYLLAEYALRNGLPPLKARFVLPLGGSTSPFVRERIEHGLGVPFLDIYGTAELGPLAFESTPGEGLRVILEHCIIEVLRDGRPARAGEVGVLVVTSLIHQAMPFIRYVIGDVGYWSLPPDNSPDCSERLHVIGRVDETLVRPDGEIVRPDVLKSRLLDEGGCFAFSLRENCEGVLDFQYVPRHGEVSKDQLVALLRTFVGGHFRIKARQVRNVRADDSGKFSFLRFVPRLQSDGTRNLKVA